MSKKIYIIPIFFMLLFSSCRQFATGPLQHYESKYGIVMTVPYNLQLDWKQGNQAVRDENTGNIIFYKTENDTLEFYPRDFYINLEKNTNISYGGIFIMTTLSPASANMVERLKDEDFALYEEKTLYGINEVFGSLNFKEIVTGKLEKTNLGKEPALKIEFTARNQYNLKIAFEIYQVFREDTIHTFTFDYDESEQNLWTPIFNDIKEQITVK